MKNIKLVVGFIAGIVVACGITAYAEYKYLATDIKYTNEKSVSQALNELYNIKQNYILPTGTIPLTTKSNQIDVSNYKYADTTGLYTQSQYEEALNSVRYDKKTINCNNYPFGVAVIDFGYIPRFIFIKAISNNNSEFVFYSDDSAQNFYFVFNCETTNQSAIFSADAYNKIILFNPLDKENWTSGKLECFAIK